MKFSILLGERALLRIPGMAYGESGQDPNSSKFGPLCRSNWHGRKIESVPKRRAQTFAKGEPCCQANSCMQSEAAIHSFLSAGAAYAFFFW